MNKTVHFKSFEARVVDDNYVEGYASTFGNVDKVGDIVEKGAFSKTLTARKEPVRFLWQHSADQPIGVVEEMREDAKGLFFRARFATTQAGQDARKALLEGVVDRFSIGYVVIQQKADQLNGRRVNRLKELRLMEVSIVTFPANEEAIAMAVKAASEGGELTEANQAILAEMAAVLLARQAANDDVSADEKSDEPEAETTEEDEAEAPDEVVETNDEEAFEKALEDALMTLKIERALADMKRKRA